MEKTTKTDLALETKSAAAESASAEKAADESTEEAPKSFETKISEALNAKKNIEVYSMMVRPSEADLKAVATNSALMTSLMETLSGHQLNYCLDKLYDHVTSIDVLEKCILYRFNVNMGATSEQGMKFKAWLLTEDIKDADGNVTGKRDLEKRWTVVGAKRVYKCLQLLPASHVAMVNDITTKNTTNGNGGVAVGSYGVFNVDYTNSKPDLTAGEVGYCGNSTTDYKYDLPTLDTTIVHELAHIVDTGQKYSARSDFRKISDWKDEGKDSAKLVKKIESYAATPYAAALSNEEKTVATKGAQRLIDNDVVKIDDISDEVSKAYDELNKDKDGSDPQKRNIFQAAWDAVTSKPKDGCRSAEDLTTVLKGSTVYQHIIRSRAISKPLPCYGGLRPDMNRQMHQGYENGVWYSYANKAYEQKISMYQFRDPGEEFAELYATYHCAAPKGSKTSDVHKQWFHKVNLHRDEPGKK